LSSEENTPDNSDIDDNLTTLCSAICDNDKSLDNNLQDADNDKDNSTKAQSTTPHLNELKLVIFCWFNLLGAIITKI